MVQNVEKPSDPKGLTLEAWSEGFMVGALIIMACVTIANMRRKVLLHKLILIELFFGTFHGTFIFPNPPVYHWYLSATVVLLNTSYSLHNVIAWIKNKPFLSRKASLFYIITVALAQPYWVLAIVANFLYFGNFSNLYTYTRPYEVLFRDPWWIFTVLNLFWNIKSRYDFGYIELIRVSPRFGILLGAMCFSVCFMLLDILAVTHAIDRRGLPDGINAFWKLSYVFKCLTDTVVLDDFKTALDRLKQHKLQGIGGFVGDGDIAEFVDVEQAQQKRDGVPLRDPMAQHYGDPQGQGRGVEKDKSDEDIDFITAVRIDDVELGHSSSKR